MHGLERLLTRDPTSTVLSACSDAAHPDADLCTTVPVHLAGGTGKVGQHHETLLTSRQTLINASWRACGLEPAHNCMQLHVRRDLLQL